MFGKTRFWGFSKITVKSCLKFVHLFQSDIFTKPGSRDVRWSTIDVNNTGTYSERSKWIFGVSTYGMNMHSGIVWESCIQELEERGMY